MKVVMNINGIEGEVVVSFIGNTDQEEAIQIAKETVCMIKENDIDIKRIEM